MPTVRHTTTIAAPPDRVFEVLADLESIGRFSPGVRAVELRDGPRTGPGARRRCLVAPMGHLDEEVVAWEPGRRMVLATRGGMPMEATADWEVSGPVTGPTTVTVTMDYALRGGPLGRAVARAGLHRRLDRTFRDNLAGLRLHVEHGTDVGRALPAGT